MSNKNKNKKKKEKVIYYDDNSTISDMSEVTGIGRKKKSSDSPPKPPSTAKEKWNTYWNAVKMMVLPMCVVLLIIGVLYLLVMLFTGNLW